MRRISPTAIQCDCGSVISAKENVCPSCGKNLFYLKQAVDSGITEEELQNSVMCERCKSFYPAYKSLCPNCGATVPTSPDSFGSNTAAILVSEQEGIIYVLINSSMPGLVKIGKTTRSSEDRAMEISTTGVPTPFEVAFEVHVSDCDVAEQVVRQALTEFRINNDREFFSMPLKQAIAHVIELTRPYSH